MFSVPLTCSVSRLRFRHHASLYPSDNLALTFGGSRSLREITTDQVRRFADTARLPASPLWRLVKDVTDHTVAAWEKLGERDLLPENMRKAIGDQIMTVARRQATV